MQARQLLILSGLFTGALGILGACGPKDAGITLIQGTAGANGSAGENGSAGSTPGTAGNTPGSAGSTPGTAGSTPGSAGSTPGTAGSTPGSAGATPGTAGSNPGTAGASTGTGGSSTAAMSGGCGMQPPALLTGKGKWVIIADGAKADGYKGSLPNPDPAPIPIKGPDGMTYNRGFYMWVPTGYDPNKPTRVIYEGAGCTSDGTDNTSDAGGSSGFPYQNVDTTNNNGEQTIQVGIQYDPFRGGCYDDQRSVSNDFVFFPYLHKWVEDNFCVDLKRQFFSGYSSGSWLANQMTCAFPDVLRGVVEATGGEPPSQPTCVTGHPVASLFLHDTGDTINPFTGILPACTRILNLNGCSTTSCSNPADTTVTSPYTPPAFVQSDGAPGSLKCRQFNGCPMDYPVVFCETTIPGNNLADHYVTTGGNWIPKLFWDFLSKF